MNKTVCSIHGCGQPHEARGWCRRHYLRWRAHGDPQAGRILEGEASRFFHEEVLTYDGDECFIWPYGRRFGYGVINHQGKTKIVSRLVCELVNGPPPTEKYDAAHSCGKGKYGCVTPAHIRWDTRAGNFADKLIHGTHHRGERHGMSKLKAADVIEIRRLKGRLTQREIAEKFGVNRVTVSDIWTGRKWGWLANA